MCRCGPVTSGKPDADFGNFTTGVFVMLLRGSMTVCARRNFGRLDVGTDSCLVGAVVVGVLDCFLCRGGRIGADGTVVFGCFELVLLWIGGRLKRFVELD